jgi:hypothetical protein
LEAYLRCFDSERKNQWSQWLPLVEWWYNTSYHTATRMTPFEVVYGQKPPLVLSYMSGVSKVQEIDQTLIVHEAFLCTLKEDLVMSQNCMKPQTVLDQRECRLCQHTIKEVLVQWKYTTPADATWEPANILQQFPHLKP